MGTITLGDGGIGDTAMGTADISSAGQGAVAVLLAAWFAATVLFALPRAGNPLARVIPTWFLSLIPSWSFFAPNPPREDRVLVYRDVLGERGVGPFREVWPTAARTGVFEGRTEKAVTDAIGELLVRARRPDDPDRKPSASAALEDAEAARVMVCTPYVQLLNRVAAAPHDPRAEAVQFAIVATSQREGSPSVVFVSATHRLDPSPAERRDPVGTC